MRLLAHAKVNLSLRVRPPGASGLHPIRSLAQTIDWHDVITLDRADGDEFTVDGDVEAGEGNLAWRALEALRAAGGVGAPVAIHLEKSIPVAAGLGGGSSDAAAVLGGGWELLGSGPSPASDIAPALGSDVRFFLDGGSAWLEGTGDRVTAVDLESDYALAVLVPAFELSTARVYRRWDELDGPEGKAVEGRSLPPSLRDYAPLVNDLFPAALSLRSELGDLAAELSQSWGGPVLMSGSGPALFGFFADLSEAREAVDAAPPGRGAHAAVPVNVGWRHADH
jgi:4-diphosphocytidyl-2-C-methyl-D-erythritol kinase